MKLESANTYTPGWFKYRTQALKNIIDAMSDDERKILEDEAEHMWVEGLLVDVQKKCVPMLLLMLALSGDL